MAYVAERAMWAEIPIYVFRYLDRPFYRQNQDLVTLRQNEIEQCARLTGGRMFSMERDESLASIIEQINVELRREYRVVYRLGEVSGPLADPSVVLDRSGLRIARLVLFKRQSLFQSPKPRP